MSLSTIEKGTTERKERHNYGPVIRDIIIGFSDGLTVPFALTAGLSSLGSSKLVITAGLAELASGAISMGLGAYLAATTERQRYLNEEKLEMEKLYSQPQDGREAVFSIMAEYGMARSEVQPLISSLEQDKEMFTKFIMDFDLKLEKQSYKFAWTSAGTMGASYFIGGLIPMIPYFAVKHVQHALFISIGITVAVLLIFGWIKTFISVRSQKSAFIGAVQTLVIGLAAAGASYGIVRGIEHGSVA